MPDVAVIGNVSRDLVEGGAAKPGGPVFYAARALQRLDVDAVVVAKIGTTEIGAFLPRLEAFGVPVACRPAPETVTFSFSYDGEARQMRVEALGATWTSEDARGWAADAIGQASWLHIGAVLRSDFPAGTLAELARGGRRLLLDGHGLARVARRGPLVHDGDFDPAVLRSVAVLKLAEIEVAATGLPVSELPSLGVPEIVVTLGSQGSIVLHGGRMEHVPANLIATRDPTGAGDTFGIGYVSARAGGAEPVEAARAGSALVARVARVKAAARTVSGIWAVDLDADELEPLGEAEFPAAARVKVSLPLVVSAAASGSTVVALLDRRPPLAISYDAGRTWSDAGGGLPAGRAVAVAADDPDRVLYGARNRLYVSEDGGRFWRSLAAELPEIVAVAWIG